MVDLDNLIKKASLYLSQLHQCNFPELSPKIRKYDMWPVRAKLPAPPVLLSPCHHKSIQATIAKGSDGPQTIRLFVRVCRVCSGAAAADRFNECVLTGASLQTEPPALATRNLSRINVRLDLNL